MHSIRNASFYAGESGKEGNFLKLVENTRGGDPPYSGCFI